MRFCKFIVCCCLLLPSTAKLAASDGPAHGPKAPFESGLRALHQERWSDATTDLQLSYAAEPSPLTAYLLGVCSAHLQDPKRTVDFMLEALGGHPDLPENYTEDAKALLKWAFLELSAPPTVRARYIMSEPGNATKDTYQLKANKDEAQQEERLDQTLRDRVGRYLNLQSLDLEASLLRRGDDCTGTTEEVNTCLDRVFRAGGAEPENLLGLPQEIELPPEPVNPDHTVDPSNE